MRPDTLRIAANCSQTNPDDRRTGADSQQTAAESLRTSLNGLQMPDDALRIAKRAAIFLVVGEEVLLNRPA